MRSEFTGMSTYGLKRLNVADCNGLLECVRLFKYYFVVRTSY